MPDTGVIQKQALRTVRSRVAAAEWQARLDCAACYRLIALFGMSDPSRLESGADQRIVQPEAWPDGLGK